MSQNGFVFWAQCKPNAKLEIYKIPDCRSFSVLKTLTGYRPYSHCVYLWLQQRKIKRVLNKVHFLNGWNPIASHLRRRMKTVKRLHLDGIQANSSTKTTGQEPGLLAPADLASLSQGPNPPKNFNFPQKVFGNNTKKCPFQPAWFDQRQHENRMQLFGKVTANNVLRKLSLLSMPNQTSEWGKEMLLSESM